MKVVRNPKSFQALMEKKRLSGKQIGFVPTMGALHEGHLSLVRNAKRENDIVAVSVFVNPLQFGPQEDFKKYPRTFSQDKRLLTGVRADVLFFPDPSKIYPEFFQTRVLVGKERKSGLTSGLCAKFRPGHFEGVATVVAKLLNLAKPHRAYFGAKDYQQAAVIRRMAADLDMDVKIRVCPIVREKDGLAMSSRNRYLSAENRTRAVSISRTLFEMKASLERKRDSLKNVLRMARNRLSGQVDRVDYLEIVDPETLEPLTVSKPEMLAVTACFVGGTRLIDNVKIYSRK